MKRGPGRPAGKLYTHKVFCLLSDQQAEWLAELARRQDVSKAELFRRLLEDEARRQRLPRLGKTLMEVLETARREGVDDA